MTVPHFVAAMLIGVEARGIREERNASKIVAKQ
jgi:hypothetical protein